jgi:hypothetical protein
MRVLFHRTRARAALVLSMCAVGTVIWAAMAGPSTSLAQLPWCTHTYWDDCSRPCVQSEYECVAYSCASRSPRCEEPVTYIQTDGSCGKVYQWTHTLNGVPFCDQYLCDSDGSFSSTDCLPW